MPLQIIITPEVIVPSHAQLYENTPYVSLNPDLQNDWSVTAHIKLLETPKQRSLFGLLLSPAKARLVVWSHSVVSYCGF